MTALETKIFKYIEEIYKSDFLGKVKVTIKDGEYCLLLTLSNYMIPTNFCYQGISEDEFYTKVAKEISLNDYSIVKHFKLIKNDNNDDQDSIRK